MFVIWLWDTSDRYNQSVYCPNPKNVQIFKQEALSVKDFYQKHLTDSLYKFPRKQVVKVIVYKNIPLIGRLFKKQLSKKQQDSLLVFLNNSEHFNWENNPMHFSEADYILKFYDRSNRLIGKVWFCFKCGRLKMTPFAPPMKFGVIAKDQSAVLLKLMQ
jgi:hypothetical protein